MKRLPLEHSLRDSSTTFQPLPPPSHWLVDQKVSSAALLGQSQTSADLRENTPLRTDAEERGNLNSNKDRVLAGYGGTCLKFQHLGDRDGRFFVSLKPAWSI